MNTVFKRDEYNCAICSGGAGRLEAHHIRPWISYPDLRFDVANGITLCDICHRGVKGKEDLFADKFIAWVRSRDPVTLTLEEQILLQPLIVTCANCQRELRRPRHRRKTKRHFCNEKCQREYETTLPYHKVDGVFVNPRPPRKYVKETRKWSDRKIKRKQLNLF